MRFLSEFFPNVIYETVSEISGPIKVVELRGQKKLLVGGLVQSVGINTPKVEQKIWGRLTDFSGVKVSNPKILILGLGGGTAAHLISKTVPSGNITAVEIDPVIVDIGYKYFDLSKIKNLTVTIADAKVFIGRCSETFDIVIVDTYKGRSFPKFLESVNILRGLRVLVSSGGAIVFNRIFSITRAKHRENFEKLLNRVFGNLEKEIIESPSEYKNYLYRARIPQPKI